MKAETLIQVAILLLLVATAASCEVAKEYSTRVFKPSTTQKSSDSTGTALKFMEFDSGNASDSIDLKEFFSREINENEKPQILKDTIKADMVIVENKNISKEPPPDAIKRGTTRSKKVRQ